MAGPGLLRRAASLRVSPALQTVNSNCQHNRRALLRLRQFSSLPAIPPFVTASPTVSSALASGRPVVALESAILTHGLPYPENLEAQLAAEKAIKDAGAIPATIAVVDGKAKVGLEESEIRRLADPSLRPKSAIKAGRRDLPYAIYSHLCAGTTVSATAQLAALYKIRVFATGGIGGVTPEAEYDVSEDLTALADTPLAVVCAGVKSILDVPKTLEYLETLGVPVVTLAEADGMQLPFPTFYSRDGPPSPLAMPLNSLSGFLHAHFTLLSHKGVLVANPIPKEFEADGKIIHDAILKARALAKERNVTGKAWTPFVLEQVRLETGGASVKSNVALYLNNARVAAQLSHALSSHPTAHPSDLLPTDAPDGMPLPTPSATDDVVNILPESEPDVSPTTSSSNYFTSSVKHSKNRPLIIGGTVLDITSRLLPSPFPAAGTSTPGHVRQSSGGVARNMAEACWRMGGEPVLCSVVGDDVPGRALVGRMRSVGMSVDEVGTTGSPTAVYSCVLDAEGGLIVGAADMRALDGLTADKVSAWLDKYLAGGEEGTPLVVADGNVTVEGIREAIARCSAVKVPFMFEPTSSVKAVRVVEALRGTARAVPQLSEIADKVSFITPNVDELEAMHSSASKLGLIPDGKELLEKATKEGVKEVLETVDVLRESPVLLEKIAALIQLFPTIVLTLGAKGVLIAQRNPPRGDHDHRGCTCCFSIQKDDKNSVRLRFKHLKPRQISPVSVTGAGDTLAGALAAGLALRRFSAERFDDLVVVGMRAAELSAKSEAAVSEGIGPGLLEEVETEEGEEDDKDWG